MSEYSTELLRKVRKELNDIELYLDKLNSQKYNRMKDAIWELKALDLSDKQIAHLLSLVFVDEEDVIYDQNQYPSATSISTSFSTTGVKEVKVLIDGVTKKTESVDFSKGDATVNAQ
mgnify:CR=1 FL=1